MRNYFNLDNRICKTYVHWYDIIRYHIITIQRWWRGFVKIPTQLVNMCAYTIFNEGIVITDPLMIQITTWVQQNGVHRNYFKKRK